MPTATWSEDPAMHELLKSDLEGDRPLRAAVPDQKNPGKCIFTGKPSTKRAIFAKAY